MLGISKMSGAVADDLSGVNMGTKEGGTHETNSSVTGDRDRMIGCSPGPFPRQTLRNRDLEQPSIGNNSPEAIRVCRALDHVLVCPLQEDLPSKSA